MQNKVYKSLILNKMSTFFKNSMSCFSINSFGSVFILLNTNMNINERIDTLFDVIIYILLTFKLINKRVCKASQFLFKLLFKSTF